MYMAAIPRQPTVRTALLFLILSGSAEIRCVSLHHTEWRPLVVVEGVEPSSSLALNAGATRAPYTNHTPRLRNGALGGGRLALRFLWR
jgi:hypothetical protein